MQIISLRNFAEAVQAACDALSVPGSVLLIPTETVYGLVCRWDDAAAREKIYALKERDGRKPLAMFAADADALTGAGVELDGAPRRLLLRFTPGPITIIAPNRDGSTTGFRIPDHPFVKALLSACGTPLASTSANHSGSPNALSVTEALSDLAGELELAIDAGSIPADSQASTVVDASKPGICRVLREGPIPADAVLAAAES
jgi:L-threonylcarbamoyladenylate synthase